MASCQPSYTAHSISPSHHSVYLASDLRVNVNCSSQAGQDLELRSDGDDAGNIYASTEWCEPCG